MMLAAMGAMALLVVAPASAQTVDDSIVEACAAALNQENVGDVVAQNAAEQTADQYQYAPGGAAQANVRGDVTEENETDANTFVFGTDVADDDDDVIIVRGGTPGGRGLQDFTFTEEGDLDIDTEVDQEGGAGGEQHADQ